MKRIIVLMAMTMVAVMLLSGPVAQVLHLPGDSTAEAKKKNKKKKRQNNRYVTINCPNRAGGNCVGTTGRDYLVGTNATDFIQGRAGNDVYYPMVAPTICTITAPATTTTTSPCWPSATFG